MSGMYGSSGAGYGMPPSGNSNAPATASVTPAVIHNNPLTGSFTYSSPSIDRHSFKPGMLQDKNFYNTYFYKSEPSDFGGQVGAKNLIPGTGNLVLKIANVWSSIGTPSFGATYSAFNLEASKLALMHINALVDVFGGIESIIDQVMAYLQGFTNGGKGFEYDHVTISKLMPMIDSYLANADPASPEYESIKKLKELLTSGKEELSKQDVMNMQIYLTTFKEIMVPHAISTKSLSNLAVDAGHTYQDLLSNQRNAAESWASHFLII